LFSEGKLRIVRTNDYELLKDRVQKEKRIQEYFEQDRFYLVIYFSYVNKTDSNGRSCIWDH
jgi:hypothetical protein